MTNDLLANVITAYNTASVNLISQRRDILAQLIDLPELDPGRQLAEQVLYLADRQIGSGGFDHARSECMLERYRELQARLGQNATGAQTSDASLVKSRALDCAVGRYLGTLMSLTRLQLSDSTSYANDWTALLAQLHSNIARRTHEVQGNTATARHYHYFDATPAYNQTSPEPQAVQIEFMKRNDRYQILPADEDRQNRVRFALISSPPLSPLTLIVIMEDGVRRDIDLARAIRSKQQLPRRDRCPKLIKTSFAPSVAFTDSNNAAHMIAFDHAAMSYLDRE